MRWVAQSLRAGVWSARYVYPNRLQELLLFLIEIHLETIHARGAVLLCEDEPCFPPFFQLLDLITPTTTRGRHCAAPLEFTRVTIGSARRHVLPCVQATVFILLVSTQLGFAEGFR